MTHEQPLSEPHRQPSAELDSGQSPSGEQQPHLSPQIWVGSLADYNNGDLHGQWLDAAREAEEIHADIQAMLARGPAARRGEAPEEWGIFDYEDFGSLRLGEYESIEDVARLAAGIVEHGPAFAAWAEATEPDEATSETFAEAYYGHFDSVADYAVQLVDDLEGDELLEKALPEWLQPYVEIDYDSLARDMELGGDIFSAPAEDGGVYVYNAI
jgi:antirestriction protein